MPTVPIPAGSIRRAGGCLQPVLLRGRVDHIDGSTGELIHRYTTVHEPGGLLPVACKTRRATRCAPCAEVYRADTYQLIRAGLTGGKASPPRSPSIRAYLSPSPHRRSARPTPAASGATGYSPAARAGTARPARTASACPATRNTPATTTGSGSRCAPTATTTPARSCSTLTPPSCGADSPSPCAGRWPAGLTSKAFAAQARLSYAKVAEYQRRGVVHFHAIVRLDGPAGPASAPPAWATVALLTDAIGQAARAVRVRTPAAPRLPSQTLAWGSQLDIRPVTSAGELTDTTVAGYVAKYATKAAECTGTLDRRVTPADRLDELPVRDHARRHIAECLRLGRFPQLADLRLTAWAHMLGFRGHFSTKSRTYSTTLGALRADRAAYQRERAIAAGLAPPPAGDTTLALAHWYFAGRGDPPPITPLTAASTFRASPPSPGGGPCPGSC